MLRLELNLFSTESGPIRATKRNWLLKQKNNNKGSNNRDQINRNEEQLCSEKKDREIFLV